MPQKIETVGIIGAGFLGTNMAIDLSLSGVEVILCDLNEANVENMKSKAFELLQPMQHLGIIPKDVMEKATQNITTTTKLTDCAKADLVIEAIPENILHKQTLVQQLEAITSDNTIIASSTISLPIDKISIILKRPKLFLGLRFLHPCIFINPVEVTPSSSTSQDTTNTVYKWLTDVLGKEPFRGPTQCKISRSLSVQFQISSAKARGFCSNTDVMVHNEELPTIASAPGPPLYKPDH